MGILIGWRFAVVVSVPVERGSCGVFRFNSTPRNWEPQKKKTENDHAQKSFWDLRVWRLSVFFVLFFFFEGFGLEQWNCNEICTGMSAYSSRYRLCSVCSVGGSPFFFVPTWFHCCPPFFSIFFGHYQIALGSWCLNIFLLVIWNTFFYHQKGHNSRSL